MISFLIKWTFFLYIFWIDLFPFCFIFQLPFLRWKRFAFLAASCILCVRAILVQIAFFLHMQVFTMFPFIWFCTRCPYFFNLMNFDQQRYVLGKPVVLTKSVLFAIAFMCFFSVVIALFKATLCSLKIKLKYTLLPFFIVIMD